MTWAATAVAFAAAGFAFACSTERAAEPGAAAAPADPAGRPAIEKPNILLVTLDTTRADRLSSYGYAAAKTPRLDEIARRGVRFAACTTPSVFTQASHASILTGTYPTFHGVRINGQAALAGALETLAERLASQSYATSAFLGAFVLDGRWGLNQGFAHYDDRFELGRSGQIDLASVQRPANVLVDAALAWLENRPDGPFLSWVHLYDAHAPYEPPPAFRPVREPGGLSGLYDGEIAFMDSQIGRLLDWLDESELAERTIVAVIGDHGEALGSHGELTHGYFLYDYAVQVPFLLRLPGERLAGRVVEETVRTIDLLPTLAELAGFEPPAATQGRSLVAIAEGRAAEPPPPAYSESMVPFLQYGWSPMFSLRAGRFKYIDAPRPELYDLELDPGEQRNLALEERERTRAMRRTLAGIQRGASAGAPRPEEANLDAETLARLAALGYVGASPAAGAGIELADPALADPKDKLAIYSEVALAGDLVNRGEHAAAARHLEHVLALDPRVPQAKLLLSTCYVESGQVDRAKTLLDEILKADPNEVQALVALANLLAREGRSDDVLAIARRALAVDERNAQAYVLIGDVYLERHDHRGALPYLEKAVEIQPKLHRNRQNLAACRIGLGELAEAERLLAGILAEHPKFPLARFHLGLVHEAQGRDDLARRDYLAELADHPESVPALFNLGVVELELGDPRSYEARMRRVIELAPDRPKGYLYLARGLLREGAPLSATRELIERGLALADSDELKALGYFLLADLEQRDGRPQEVERALAKAREHAARTKSAPGAPGARQSGVTG